MFQFLNQTSYIIVALVALAAAGAAAFRLPGPILVRAGLVLLVAMALLAALLVLRTGRGVISATDVAASIGGGRPLLIEFYSDF